MAFALRWLLAVVTVLGAASVTSSAEPMPTTDKTGPPKPVDSLKLPPGAIYVVTSDALTLLPRLILMTPEAYQKLLDEREKLKAAPKKAPVPANALHLKGRVERNGVFLHAEYEIQTTEPNTVVGLGARQATVANPLFSSMREPAGPMDKARHIPALRPDPEKGYTILLDEPEPKGCRVTLDLTLLLKAESNSRSFVLDLPQAAITDIELTLPPEARDVRFGDQPLAETLLTLKDGVLTGSLNHTEPRLALGWKETPRGGNGPGVQEADSVINVRVEGRLVNITARMNLQVRGGIAERWDLLVPPDARVRVAAADEPRVKIGDPIRQRFAWHVPILLKEPSAEPLQVLVELKYEKRPPRMGESTAVGPFIAKGAIRQSGTIVVNSTGPEPRFHPHGDTTRRETTAREVKEFGEGARVFGFDQVPQPEKPTSAAGVGSYSLLDIEPDAGRGLIETTTTHTLKLERVGTGREWKVYTRIKGTLVNPGMVAPLDVAMPPGCEWVPSDLKPGLPVTDVLNPMPGKVVVKLASEPSWKSFTITLQGRYAAAGDSEGKTTFALPQLLNVAAGSRTEIIVEVPDDVELLPNEQSAAAVLTAKGPHKQTWPEPRSVDAERPPEAVELAWRPYRPEVRVVSVADVTLLAAEGQVRQQLRFRFPAGASRPVTLRFPAGLKAGRFQIVEGGEALAEKPTDGQLRVRLKSGGAEATLLLEYSFLLPAASVASSQPFEVPLVVPLEATGGETRSHVHVWSEPGTLPDLDDNSSDWSRQHLVKVKNHPGLPVLVLQTQRLGLPLHLRLGQASSEQRVSVLAERALIRVQPVDLAEGGGYRYRASFFLAKLQTRHLDVELPAPVTILKLEVKLDGQTVGWEVLDDHEKPDLGGTIARLRLDPELVQRASILEVAYHVPAGRANTSVLQTVLQPPMLRGEPRQVLTRWQVTLPPGWVVLGPEGGAGTSRTWVRNGWLLMPRLNATSADNERWLAGTENRPSSSGATAGTLPDLICLRGGLDPLTVAHVPLKPWLACCSIGAVLIGLALYFLGRRAGRGKPTWFWATLAILTCGLGVVWLFLPTALTALALGAQLSVPVLVVFASMLWLVHERQRRRIVFLPSFRRGGSSLLRAGASANGPSPVPAPKSPEEPSTVDAPRPVISNH